MATKFQHFLSTRRGNVAITFAIVASAVMALVGFGIDYGRASDSETKIQAALDAAVLAAIHEAPENREAVARRYFDGNGQLAMASVNELSFTSNGDGTYTGTAMAKLPTAFASLINIPVLNIAVTSTAIAVAAPAPCLLSLDPRAANAIWVHSNARIRTRECGTGANSSHDNAVHIEGELRTMFLHVAGGINGPDNDIDAEEGITINAEPMNDPLQALNVPAFSGCGGGTNLTVEDDTTLSPGVYCGGLTIRNGARVDLQPGTYILNRGDLDMAEISEIEGENVTIILTSSGSPSDIGSFKITDHSRVRFTAPSAGTFARVALYQDRRAPTTRNNLVSGVSSGKGPGPEIRVDGTIYAPAQEIRLTGDGRIRVDPDAACAHIVANSFDVQNNSRIRLRCDDDTLLAGVNSNSSGVRLMR